MIIKSRFSTFLIFWMIGIELLYLYIFYYGIISMITLLINAFEKSLIFNKLYINWFYVLELSSQ